VVRRWTLFSYFVFYQCCWQVYAKGNTIAIFLLIKGDKMEKLKIGDWVYYAGDEQQLEGALGYVDRIIDSYCVVEFVQDYKGKRLNRRKICTIEELIPAKSKSPMTKEDFDTLIDLALATKDFEWCKQLMEQLKGQENDKVV
jgi:hypothetical protein